MSLNIKDEEVHKLVKELARETGQPMTKAVGQAVRAELKRLRQQKHRRNMSEDLLAIGRRLRKRMKGPVIDHADLLYDERGLPK